MENTDEKKKLTSKAGALGQHLDTTAQREQQLKASIRTHTPEDLELIQKQI